MSPAVCCIGQMGIALLAIGRDVAIQGLKLEAALPRSPESVGSEAGALR